MAFRQFWMDCRSCIRTERGRSLVPPVHPSTGRPIICKPSSLSGILFLCSNRATTNQLITGYYFSSFEYVTFRRLRVLPCSAIRFVVLFYLCGNATRSPREKQSLAAPLLKADNCEIGYNVIGGNCPLCQHLHLARSGYYAFSVVVVLALLLFIFFDRSAYISVVVLLFSHVSMFILIFRQY